MIFILPLVANETIMDSSNKRPNTELKMNYAESIYLEENHLEQLEEFTEKAKELIRTVGRSDNRVAAHKLHPVFKASDMFAKLLQGAGDIYKSKKHVVDLRLAAGNEMLLALASNDLTVLPETCYQIELPELPAYVQIGERENSIPTICEEFCNLANCEEGYKTACVALCAAIRSEHPTHVQAFLAAVRSAAFSVDSIAYKVVANSYTGGFPVI